MPNQRQVSILMKGVKIWNEWRLSNKEIEVDLSSANLERSNLSHAHLWKANLNEAKIQKANLIGANLSGATLCKATLQNAHLDRADLKGANLSEADFWGAVLSESNLKVANLSGTMLSHANLRGANLNGANLNGAKLWNANLMNVDFSNTNLLACSFSDAHIGNTIFNNVNLGESRGLEDVYHESPSVISTYTLVMSQGKIPESFLRGCGMSNLEIESAKLLNLELTNREIDEILYKIHDIRAHQPLQISPLFISYSHGDNDFVEKLETYLDRKGIRFWRDVHDATSGRLEKVIDQAMRVNPTVLLILSEKSLRSDWVEHEVRRARELEKDIGHDVLCPIALDDSWKNSPWPKRVMEQVMEYNILDFSAWEDGSRFEVMFRRLIDGLQLFYKGK